MRLSDRFRGCLVGGAAGDALGYAVEFLTEEQIFRQYGSGGITSYTLRDGLALVSDDTQMTLFTAEGLLNAEKGGEAEAIRRACLAWLKTQQQSFPEAGAGGLAALPALYSCRAPGMTCLSALQAGANGTPEAPINNSKGCGGVMRMAPVGLFYADEKKAALLAARAAAQTHGHPLGWLSAAAFGCMVSHLVHREVDMKGAVQAAIRCLHALWPDREMTDELCGLLSRAVKSAQALGDDRTAIHALGAGWVGDEALAIAVYCAVKYEQDFHRALVAAVNHDGDSDSTGAICGNLLGARLGLSGIPETWLHGLELKDVLLQTADALRARMEEETMVTKQDIFDFLQQMGIRRDDTLTIHAALRQVGPIENGADGLIDGLTEYLNEGLLLVPTHTWANVNRENPHFDVRSTVPCIGTLAKVAAQRRDGIRSLHPTHSMAAFGKDARAYIQGEENSHTPAPMGGALSRLYDVGGKVILLGIGHERNTYLHAVDERVDVQNRLAPDGFDVTITDWEGNRHQVKDFHPHYVTGLPSDVSGCSEYYPNYKKAFEVCGAVQYGKLGNALVYVCDVRKMTDQMMKIWSRADRDMCVCDMEIPVSWYE